MSRKGVKVKYRSGFGVDLGLPPAKLNRRRAARYKGEVDVGQGTRVEEGVDGVLMNKKEGGGVSCYIDRHIYIYIYTYIYI